MGLSQAALARVQGVEYLRRLARDGSQIFQQNGLFLLVVIANVFIISFATVSHSHSVATSSRFAEFEEVTSMLTNVNGPLSERLTNFGLNAFRNSISFLLYPFTTLRKLHQSRSDDFILGFGPLNSLIYDPRGLNVGPSIVRDIKADAAHGSIFLLPLIGILSGLFARGLLTSGSRPLLQGKRMQLARPSFILLLSCCLAFLFFSYAIFNTPFTSKYMGPTYVPLIPLLAVGLAQIVDLKRKPIYLGVCIALLYAVLRFGYLLNFPLTPSFIGSAIIDPPSFRWRQSGNLFFYQFAGSRFKPDEADRWLAKLSDLPPDRLNVLCFNTGTASLTPLMYAIQSYNQNKDIELVLANVDDCKKGHVDAEAVGKPDTALKGAKKTVNYIFFP